VSLSRARKASSSGREAEGSSYCSKEEQEADAEPVPSQECRSPLRYAVSPLVELVKCNEIFELTLKPTYSPLPRLGRLPRRLDESASQPLRHDPLLLDRIPPRSALKAGR
jgi:hypothetical protein